MQQAAEILKSGGLVAFPTETVYGLGARGLDPVAVARIFEAKGRPSHNPLILHINNFTDARPLWRCASREDEAALLRAESLAREFWPGPLTLVHYKSEIVPDITTGGNARVALRAPSHPVARDLIQYVGEPLAAPSANASGRVSPTSAAHVLESLNHKIDAVLDGGICEFGLESTVVDVTHAAPVILRAGALPESEILRIFPNLQIHGVSSTVSPAASPGNIGRHYAPRIGEIVLLHQDEMARAWESGDALLARQSTADYYHSRLGARGGVSEFLPDEPAAFAREIYAAFYRLERAAPERLFIEFPPDESGWRAVRDRLRRAAEKED